MDGKVIADPKVVNAFNESHIAQMLAYLNITGLDVARTLPSPSVPIREIRG